MSGDAESVQENAEHAERLASWLESLGLHQHLAEAGLPTMVRDCHGRATWRDPGTGEPLTSEQLTQLDTLLHDQGDEPARGVPVTLVQLRRKAQVRATLTASPWHTYESLADLRGATVSATRFAVHKASNAGELLVVPRGEGEESIVPAFQLDATGVTRPELVPVLQALAGPTVDAWATWAWLTQPVALLGGGIPADLASDPAEAPVVLRAAQALAKHR